MNHHDQPINDDRLVEEAQLKQMEDARQAAVAAKAKELDLDLKTIPMDWVVSLEESVEKEQRGESPGDDD